MEVICSNQENYEIISKTHKMAGSSSAQILSEYSFESFNWFIGLNEIGNF